MTRFVHYYPGAMGDSGVTVALWGWVAALRSAGFEALVLHAGDEAGEQHTAESFVADRGAGLAHAAIPHRGRGRLLRHPVALARHLRRGDILVLHEGWVTNNVVAARAARRAGIPYLVVPHGVYEPLWRRYLRQPRAIRSAVERRLLEGAAAVHLFFASEGSALMALAPSARVVVAPTGMTVPEDRWRGGGGYLAWIGRYDPTHKGLDLLVEALAALPPERRPRVRLRGYDYRRGLDSLRTRVADHPGLDRWIEVGGPISGREKRVFLVEADGYLLPSRWESHSVALLEALALGMPSLVSGTLHVASDLRRHRAAVLTMPDVEDLTRGLVAVGEDCDMGDRARTMVETEFSWKGAVDDLVGQLATLGLIG